MVVELVVGREYILHKINPASGFYHFKSALEGKRVRLLRRNDGFHAERIEFLEPINYLSTPGLEEILAINSRWSGNLMMVDISSPVLRPVPDEPIEYDEIDQSDD